MNMILLTQPLQLDIRDKLLGDHDKQARKMIAEKDLPMENRLLSVFDKLITFFVSNKKIRLNFK